MVWKGSEGKGEARCVSKWEREGKKREIERKGIGKGEED